MQKEEQRWLLEVVIGSEEAKAILYPLLTGEVSKEDRVLLNTTAVSLNLGTGGYHFVMKISGKGEKQLKGPGHIMKMRYTPFQIKVNSWEEQNRVDDSPLPLVLAISLHSMLAPLAIVLNSCGIERVGYIMTDGGALPLWFSDSVRVLKEGGYLSTTITSGHAFGGDWETINVYTAILAAAEQKCEAVIIGPGPGHVGTGSKWGFSGIEQGENLNAASLLGCSVVGIPRVSFQDKRVRHQGISHHSLTALGKVCRVPVNIFLPKIKGPRGSIIQRQALHFADKKVNFLDLKVIKGILNKNNRLFAVMGRNFSQDPLYFLTCALGGIGGSIILKGGNT